MNEQTAEERTDIVVDARVVIDGIDGPIVHFYEAVAPVGKTFRTSDGRDEWANNGQDWLYIYQNGESVASYGPKFWKAVETSNPRPYWVWNIHRHQRMTADAPAVEVSYDDVQLTMLRKEIGLVHSRLNEFDERLTALSVGFSDLRQHIGPLLTCLRKEEYYTVPDFRSK